MTLTTARHPAARAQMPSAPRRITETTAIRDELLRAVDFHERAGAPTPCRAVPDPFTSDDAADRRAATELCGGCPLRDLCRDYAAEAGESWGVWGGRDRKSVV